MWENWKYLQKIKKNKVPLWRNGFLPSQTYFKYPPNSTFGGLRVLNVGCGQTTYKAPNVVNLDLCPAENIQVVCDLSKTPYPLESESFDLIIANHVLEHIPNWWECFKELTRVLKPGGILEIWIPPVSSDTAFTYRDHINRIGEESFAGTGYERRPGTNLAAAVEMDSLPELKRMDIVWHGKRTIVRWWVLFAPNWLKDWMCAHLRNIVSEIGFKFRKN